MPHCLQWLFSILENFPQGNIVIHEQMDYSKTNMSFVIQKLSFGDEYPGTLEFIFLVCFLVYIQLEIHLGI